MKYLLPLFLIFFLSNTQEFSPINNLPDGSPLPLQLHGTTIYVKKGAYSFNLYNQKITSSIGPIQAIRTVVTPEGIAKIEWYNGKKHQNTSIPLPPQTWQEYIENLPDYLIAHLFRYFMGYDLPTDNI